MFDSYFVQIMRPQFLKLAVAPFDMRSCLLKHSFSGNEPTLLGVTLRTA